MNSVGWGGNIYLILEKGNVMDINTILTSTIIAAMITSIFSFVRENKNNKLQYITLERQKWREEIREISEMLEGANKDNVRMVLVKLKSRINAYGYRQEENYLSDGHIWRQILLLDKSKELEDIEFAREKERLIIYLSLLLKYDWERTKNEVVIDRHVVAERVALFLFAILFFFVSFYFEVNVFLAIGIMAAVLIFYLSVESFFNIVFVENIVIRIPKLAVIGVIASISIALGMILYSGENIFTIYVEFETKRFIEVLLSCGVLCSSMVLWYFVFERKYKEFSWGKKIYIAEIERVRNE